MTSSRDTWLTFREMTPDVRYYAQLIPDPRTQPNIAPKNNVRPFRGRWHEAMDITVHRKEKVSTCLDVVQVSSGLTLLKSQRRALVAVRDEAWAKQRAQQRRESVVHTHCSNIFYKNPRTLCFSGGCDCLADI